MSWKKGDKIGPGDRYEIEDALGSGTYGKVWKAFDCQMRRQVAIKALHGGKTAVEKLASEAVLGGLSHKNIVQIFDYCAEGGFMVMECVKGKSLETMLREHIIAGTWPDKRQILAIIEQLLEALEYAHENQRIHGDVKPGNILVPDRGETKLADFGVSIVLSSATGLPVISSSNAGLRGSASFAAPEILETGVRAAGVRSDLFSAGGVAYLLLTRKHPFLDQSGLFKIPELIRRKDFQLTPLRSINKEIPEDYETLVLKLLKHNVSDRYKSATEALEVIRPKLSIGLPCPKCGYENLSEAIFCSRCGTELIPETTSLSTAEQAYWRARRIFFFDLQPEKAEEILRSHLPTFRNEKMAQPLTLLGFILNNRRKYIEAKKFGEEAQAIDPNLVESYRVISFSASQLGNTSEAIEELERALEKTKDNYTKADILYQRARTYQSVGDFFSACADVTMALELNPMHEKARRLRDIVCI